MLLTGVESSFLAWTMVADEDEENELDPLAPPLTERLARSPALTVGKVGIWTFDTTVDDELENDDDEDDPPAFDGRVTPPNPPLPLTYCWVAD